MAHWQSFEEGTVRLRRVERLDRGGRQTRREIEHLPDSGFATILRLATLWTNRLDHLGEHLEHGRPLVRLVERRLHARFRLLLGIDGSHVQQDIHMVTAARETTSARPASMGTRCLFASLESR